MELREKLAALRREKGLSQLEVSEELNVSRQAVSKWEVGDTVPSTNNLKCLARLYGVPLEYLFDEEADSTPEERTVGTEVPVGVPACEGDKSLADRVRFWKRLAAAAIIFCGILSVILFYIKISEKPGDHQNSISIKEVEGVIVGPSGSFDFEW